MTGTVLDAYDILTEDALGCTIAKEWIKLNTFRNAKLLDWEEVRKYVYATDTTMTSNSKLPWKNKTTIPKMCQIRDNLSANYMATCFPRRKWLTWVAASQDSNSLEKRLAIINYATHMIEHVAFKSEMNKLILDYIDYGNCFVTVDWQDYRQELPDKTQVGYIGPVPKRISPLDIVFNPTASSFYNTPKIVRSIVSLGEVKEMLTRMSTPENEEEMQDLFKYLREIRNNARTPGVEVKSKDEHYRIEGFTSFQSYLSSDYCEILTFYGDIYDYEKDEFLRNHVITVVDRHKVIGKKPNPSFFGFPPIFHAGWRKRQDNLWAMGPLDNLVGMQYRVDHIENLKADAFDLITFPPLKVKGYVPDFEWGPMKKILMGDDGDVEMLAPPFQVLQANVEIENLQRLMEEMAGSPKEAMGFRSPGEKTKYEVQRLENAASRIFQNKTSQFEEGLVEPLLNAMLELARRNITSVISIPVFSDEFKMQTFLDLSVEDLTGAGRIKPIAARHFAEKAETVQNLTSFFGSALGMDEMIKQHFSAVKTAKLFEELLDIEDYELVQPYVRITEAAEAQDFMNVHQEQVAMKAQTPSGLSPDDADMALGGGTGGAPF